ncbi:CRE-NIPA-1 protein [Caenorhabditis remanei]|uniref:CRE-NIPA-1 protein n=1 Tax=Caenorhabditis remanei TaxID=31234 RepID=E3MWB3_CAERE|nr:CRE-NIPA-1 protein [Caenorhabditis remanei]
MASTASSSNGFPTPADPSSIGSVNTLDEDIFRQIFTIFDDAILSSRMLNERLNLLGSIGCALCLLGSTVIVIHSPKEEEVGSMAELALKMKDAGFLIYVILIILATGFIVVYVAPRYGHSNILVYISVCSLIGSLSVLSVKGLGLAIKMQLFRDVNISLYQVQRLVSRPSASLANADFSSSSTNLVDDYCMRQSNSNRRMVYT